MLEPLPGSQWNTTTAAHLVNRAGFGGSPQDIENLRQMGMGRAVSWFVDYERIPDDTPAPDWAHPDPGLILQREAIRNAADPETRKMLQQQQNQEENAQMADLRYWWVRRMALGPRPFQEKMTLFWHGHFATSFEKVRMPYFLWLQNETLRQYATGNFNQLLIAVAEDPAMLDYLDGERSHRNKPNENFAREVMELFTLGEGHYTERDVQQAAKAYTGWGLAQDRLNYQYHPNDHDNGPKTVFGQTGNFTGEDVLNMICAKPECAQFIAKKIWRFFVQDEPPQPVIDALATEFHNHDMDLKHLMTVIFRSKEFYAPVVIRSQIKSPVQWLIAGTHQLQAPLPTRPMTLVMLRQLGEELFNPPNVKGWDGGIAWITTNSLLDRQNFAAALVEGDRVPLPGLKGQMQSLMNATADDQLMQIAPADVSALFSVADLSSPAGFLDALQARFLNAELDPQRLASFNDFLKSRSPLEESDIRKAIRLIMCTPEYQLT
ncbi:MAG: DUF1800 domain-containing protein [Methylacidiphilales bacterium]|nr:DUF1800 domain-containing protein [Candidatus Methylacidiphilales bacterium]